MVAGQTTTVSGPPGFLPVLLPIGLGLVGVYYLLPKPKGYPLWAGVVCSAAAIISAGALLVRYDVLTPEVLLFLTFSALAIISGGLLITLRNPVRAALSFALVILSTCGLFLLQAAPFLTAATIIVYAGAIIVTFLFVIMLAQQEGLSDADRRSREPMLSAVAGFVLLAALLYVLVLNYDTRRLDQILAEIRLAQQKETVAEIEKVLGDEIEDGFSKKLETISIAPEGSDRPLPLMERINTNDFMFDLEWMRAKAMGVAEMKKVLGELAARIERIRNMQGQLQPAKERPLSSFSGRPANQQASSGAGRKESIDTVALLGRSLVTDYLFSVELAGVLLLVAVVGAIVIAGRQEGMP
ncbi:MAG: hypothetical protein KatS3mg105_1507 [Gemmatales bacterium]|nr:MAG: hypothetical protein KatS3mg105_1507 [Gemmatales bacterium]